MIAFLISLPVYAASKSFMDNPVMPGGKVGQKTEKRMELSYSAAHDEILDFYRVALKQQEDIKFRNWKDETRIEDNGKFPWHSIIISKHDKNDTKVVIVKDNWTWIIGTLVIRYIGVFVVLLVLYLGMALSGRIISNMIKKSEEAA